MSEEALFCLRVRYVETGRLRFLSHLEMLGALERTVRRSGLPYAVTQGFSPRIKAAYCPALPVGVASHDEWFDLWVRAYRPACDYLAALRAAAPDDLAPQEAAYVDLHAPSLSAALTLATWEIELYPCDETDSDAVSLCAPDRVAAAFEALRARGSIEYMRDRKPRTVELDGKFASEPVVRARPGGRPGVLVEVTTRSSNAGSLRPDVLMGAVRGQLAETSTVRVVSDEQEGPSVVSWEHRLRTSIVRTAQYLEGKDGSWVRPI